MATGASLVEDAFLLANIIGAGETVSSEDQTLGLKILNRMIGSWATENLMSYATVTDSFLMTANQASYSTTLLTQRPVSISSMYVSLSSIDYPVEMLDQQTYQAIPYKPTPAIPDKCFYDPTFPNGTFYFYPTPYAAFTCYVSYRAPLTGTLTAATTVSLPPGTEEAIVSNLALRSCVPFEKQPNPILTAQANESKANLKRVNYEPLEMNSVMDKSYDVSNAFIYRGF